MQCAGTGSISSPGRLCLLCAAIQQVVARREQPNEPQLLLEGDHRLQQPDVSRSDPGSLSTTPNTVRDLGLLASAYHCQVLGKRPSYVMRIIYEDPSMHTFCLQHSL